MASGSMNGIIQVWDLAQHAPLRQITNTAGAVIPIEFMAHSSKLLTGSIEGWMLHEWDLATGRQLLSWQFSSEKGSMANSPDENLAVMFGPKGEFDFKNLATGQLVETNLNFLGASAATFSPDSQNFAVASTYGYARVWDAKSWQVKATLSGFLSAVSSVAYSPDGQRLATGAGKQQALSLWDTASWQNVLTLDGQGAGFSCLFSPDGNVIGAVNVDGTLHLWRAPSGAEIKAADPASAQQP